MGIRLYMRNKTASGAEFCLGKLFYYVDEKDGCNGAAKFLSESGALIPFFNDLTDFEFCKNDIDRFLTACHCITYIDYGEFFSLHKKQIHEFLGFYFRDWKKFQDAADWQAVNFYDKACSFIDAFGDGDIWEFRLGA